MKGRYAVMAIVDIAQINAYNQSSVAVKLSDISIRQDISIAYLEQIFRELKKAEIVTSVRGRDGGYKLAKNPSEIKVSSIIKAVKEKIKMTRCGTEKTLGPCSSDVSGKCATHFLWKGLGKQIEEYLSSITVEDVLTDKL